MVYGEWGMQPLQLDWAKRTARFWNGLVKLAPRSPLVAGVMQHSVAAAIPPTDSGEVEAALPGMWAAQLVKAFSHILPASTLVGSLRNGTPLDVDVVYKGYRRKYAEYWDGPWGDPRDTQCSNRNGCTYATHFRSTRGGLAPFLAEPISHRHKVLLARMRTGCHELPVDVVHMHRKDAQPWCAACGPGHWGDVQHVVFECPCTAPLRQNLLSVHGIDIGGGYGTLRACFDTAGYAEFGPICSFMANCVKAFQALA
jgi:hypothetical protein